MIDVSAQAKKMPQEIDVRELAVRLWRKKWLILFITIVPLALSCIYVYTRPPLFQVTVKIMSVPESALASYNTAARSASDATAGILTRASLATISPLSSRKALAHVVEKLKAHSTGGLQFQPAAPTRSADNNSTSDEPRFEGIVQGAVSGDIVPFAVISFSSTQSTQLSQSAKRYVEQMLEATKHELVNNLQIEVTRRINDMKAYHEVMKKVAMEETGARAERVREALMMAEKMGLENPPLGGPYFLLTERLPEKSALTDDNLMYLRGAVALRAELKRLERRINIDPHVFMLPYMLRKTEQLKLIEIQPESIDIAYIDGYSLTPTRSFRVADLLLPFLAGLFGFLTAVLLAAFLSYRDKT